MRTKRDDDEAEGAMPARLDSDRPKDRDLLDKLSAKWLRLEDEAVRLATTMRRKPKAS